MDYTFTGATRDSNGTVVRRIRYSDGTLGGFIEKESNLSGDASLLDDAVVKGNAVVKDNAIVQERAVVCGYSVVSGNSSVGGHSFVGGNAHVCDNSYLRGRSSITGRGCVRDNAILDSASVRDSAILCGNALAGPHVIVDGSAVLSGNASVLRYNEYISIPALSVTFFRDSSEKLAVRFRGEDLTPEEFEEEAENTGGRKGKSMKAALALAEEWIVLHDEKKYRKEEKTHKEERDVGQKAEEIPDETCVDSFASEYADAPMAEDASGDSGMED